MFHLGFSYIGFIWLLMLTIPNLIWTKNKPVGYEESKTKENKVLLIFERIGQGLVTLFALIFSDFNVDLNARSTSSLIVLGISFLLMVCYELYWIRYFKSEKTLQDFYSSFLGMPVAGATYPVLAFFVLGLYGSNAPMLFAVTILGIGHIGIHFGHKHEVIAREKTKLPVQIIKCIGIVALSLAVLGCITFFGAKNIAFIKELYVNPVDSHAPKADEPEEATDVITNQELQAEIDEKVDEASAKEQEVLSQKEHEYIPDKSGDSYYSLTEDNCPLDVKTQQSGTCWTCAITSSIEGAYYKKNHEKLSFDATDLCLKIYDDDKLEGWFVHRDKLDYGGWNWLACDYLPNGYEGYYLKDAWNYDGNSIDEMKEGIKNHGPIAVAVCDNTLYKRSFDGYFTMNDDNPDHLDHAVIIIGWDDNFPKDYFKIPAKEDGAWICQNSKSKGWGNDGIYYISYESIIAENVIFSVTNEYSDVAFYDAGNEKQIETGDVCVVANVFDKKGTLAGIGTYTNSDYQKYKIEIYEGTFGKLLYSFDGVSDIKGYHVADLPEPIEVENYTVAISFEGLASVEGESYVIDDDLVEYVAASSKKQSFVWIDGEWVDMSSSDIKERLDIDFMPNNACIKALYQ